MALISFSAHSQTWTRAVSNDRLKWKAGGLVNVPTGYSADLNNGTVSADNYYLKINKNAQGRVVSVNESFRKPNTVDKSNTKSSDIFEVKRTLFAENGQVFATTDCSGSRTLTTGWGMVTSLLQLSLGNERVMNCRTTTAAMCKTLRQELAGFGRNHSIKQYGEACQAYAKDMSAVFNKVMESFPEGLLRSEKAEAEKFFKQASQGSNFDYSSVNLSLVLSETKPAQRIESLNTGMVMFNELIEIEKSCGDNQEDEVKGKAPLNKAGKGTAASS